MQYIDYLVVSACLAVHVTIFSSGGKFRLVSKFYALTQACPSLCTLGVCEVHSQMSSKLIDAYMNARVCDDIIFIADVIMLS